MLIRLMYEDAINICDGELHVSPEHIVSVCLRSDGKLGFLQLDSPIFSAQVGASRSAKTTYQIDLETYRRVVDWMEFREDSICLRAAVDDGERYTMAEVMEELGWEC